MENTQQQLVMDDMMEQILSMPTWSDTGLETMIALLNTGQEGSMVLDGSGLINKHKTSSSSSLTYEQPVYASLPLDADLHMLGKRFHDQQQPILPGQDRMFSNFPTSTHITHVSEASIPRSSPAPQIRPPSEVPEAASRQPAKPRVRARRGQATDPHSIAERLRRERIAERMKSLQELVPNSNKTDKASMLDEIIDYVKFLQLQVKVLSMSRLGNAGAVMADLPAEDSNKFLSALGQNGYQEGVSLTERQVAKLMEEDMGSAMQYLQSKGLCLMPIHLASNMSKTNSKNSDAPHKASAKSEDNTQKRG